MKLTLAFALMLSGPAFAQDGVALPVNGQLALWDMQTDPPAEMADPAADAVAGACYDAALQPAGVNCLSHYTHPAPADAAIFTAMGRTAFNDIIPDYAFRGLELRDVDGITDCGERDGCDTLYIAGFTDADLTVQAMEAAREGKVVTLTGRQFWNAESIDMIVEALDPAP